MREGVGVEEMVMTACESGEVRTQMLTCEQISELEERVAAEKKAVWEMAEAVWKMAVAGDVGAEETV